ncbi:MAG: hypothetical protein K6B65_05495 [Bacilli bacterium]|nr:hypothetical protein [Bacilli bacterium]
MKDAINKIASAFQKDALIKRIRKIDVFPFLLFFLSFLPFVIFFRYPGYPNGDDIIWHKSYIFDLVYGWRNGFYGINGGHNFLGTSGYNIYLFYSPLPHVFIGLLVFIFNMPIVTAIKVGTIVITYVGALFSYLLGKRITGNRALGFAAGIAFIFFPYRIYDLIGRDAICEGFAISFVPMLFYGVYSILNDDSFRVSSYISAIIASAGLVLSHPYTALLSAIAAVAIIVFSPIKLWNVVKRKQTWVAVPVSLLLILGLVAFYLFPMLEATGSELYNISNNSRMLTNRDYLISTLDGRWTKSGFLNFNWLETQTKLFGDSAASWISEMLLFPFCGGVSIFLLNYLEKKGRPIFALLSSIAVIILPLVFLHREEYVMASVFFGVCLLFTHFQEKEIKDREEMLSLAKRLPKQTEVYGLILVLIFEMLLIWTAFIWKIVPEIFLMSQFTFRSWAIFVPLLTVIVCILLKPFAKSKYVQEGVLLSSFFLLVVCMPMVTKRTNYYAWRGYSEEPTLGYVRKLDRVGWQSEYAPRCFYESYSPKYPNGLYQEVKKELTSTHDFAYTIEEYRTPAFIEGEGEMNITSLNIPNATFDLSVISEEGFVQLPQFYYSGYHLTLTGDREYKIEGEYADGLVAFHVKKGSYTATLTYDNPTSFRVARPFFYISVSLLPLMGVGGYIYRKRNEEKAANLDAATE